MTDVILMYILLNAFLFGGIMIFSKGLEYVAWQFIEDHVE